MGQHEKRIKSLKQAIKAAAQVAALQCSEREREKRGESRVETETATEIDKSSPQLISNKPSGLTARDKSTEQEKEQEIGKPGERWTERERQRHSKAEAEAKPGSVSGRQHTNKKKKVASNAQICVFPFSG